jgi:hypothetical protein
MDLQEGTLSAENFSTSRNVSYSRINHPGVSLDRIALRVRLSRGRTCPLYLPAENDGVAKSRVSSL